MADDEVGAGVDDRVGERDRVAAPLAEVRLRPPTDVGVGRPLRAGVHVHDDDVRARGGGPHQPPRLVEVEQVGGPRVGREAEHGHLDAGRRARPRSRPRGRCVAIPAARSAATVVSSPSRPGVARVVVREAHDGEAGAPERMC